MSILILKLGVSVATGFIGGYVQRVAPLLKTLWVAGLLQMFSNLAYVWLASVGADPETRQPFTFPPGPRNESRDGDALRKSLYPQWPGAVEKSRGGRSCCVATLPPVFQYNHRVVEGIIIEVA